MIDTENLAEFERQFAAVLDALDRLKKLRAPRDPKMSPEVRAWFDEFENAVSTLPDIGDPDQLTRTGEDIDAAISKVNQKADMALSMQGQEQDEDVLLPDDVIKWAKVVECYDASGGAWTDYFTDQSYARFCSANPCSGDGTYVDTGTTIYIELPVFDGIPGFESPHHSGAGITYLPENTIIPYLETRRANIAGYAIAGIEAGWFRRIPYVLPTPDAETSYNETPDWGLMFTPGEIAACEDDTQFSVLFKSLKIDPCGRVVWSNPSAPLASSGRTITATVDVPDHGTCTVKFTAT